MGLEKWQLWLVDGVPLCVDHVLFSHGETGRRCTPEDYVEWFETYGRPMRCKECAGLFSQLEGLGDDPERNGKLHFLFGKGRASRRERSRRAHPSSGETAWRTKEQGEQTW